jgi:hypothetical protein
VGFPPASNARSGDNASPVSAASNTSPHISDAVPMSKMTGPSAAWKAEGYRVGPKSRAGCAGRHDVRRAAGGVQTDKSGIDAAGRVKNKSSDDRRAALTPAPVRPQAAPMTQAQNAR